MKSFKKTSKRSVMAIGALCILSVMLSSCLKDHTNDVPPTPISVLSVVQGSPGQPTLNFTLDGSRVNTNPLALGNVINYFNAYTGDRTAAFVNATSGAAVFSDKITLKQNTAYSLCLVGATATPSFLLLTDSLAQPASGMAGLRFVNLSPDDQPVDLAVSGGATIAANKHFKEFTPFQSVSGKTYNFEIRKAGTTTVLATMNSVTINSGYAYTIYLQGLAASTGADKLTGTLITNAQPN